MSAKLTVRLTIDPVQKTNVTELQIKTRVMANKAVSQQTECVSPECDVPKKRKGDCQMMN